MKKTLVIIVFSLCCISAFARVRTVSNYDSSAQFRTIQTAIDSSSAGDSVYVNGSPYSYAGFTLNKALAVFGPGWSPDEDVSYVAQIQTDCAINASNCELHGLTFASYVRIDAQGIGGSSNIKFIRNKFTGNFYVLLENNSNLLFEGNWFDNTYLYNQGALSYITVENNIFYQSSHYSAYNFYNSTNVIFDHNLWYGPSSGSSDCFGGCYNLFLNNNIFVHRNAYNSNSGSTFRNNITYLTTEDNPWKSPNIDGLGNIAGASPKMVDELNVDNGIDNALMNFTLQASSPGKHAATDAKDLGLLYDPGLENWTRSRGVDLPFVSKMTLTNNSILVGQKLKFTADAKSN
jgi:hypothetical protein